MYILLGGPRTEFCGQRVNTIGRGEVRRQEEKVDLEVKEVSLKEASYWKSNDADKSR